MHLDLDELKGKTVIDAMGRVVGRLETAFVDTPSFAVDAFRVKLRKEVADRFGFATSWWRSAHLDVPVGVVGTAGDTVLLRAAVEELAPLVGHPVDIDTRPPFERWLDRVFGSRSQQRALTAQHEGA